MAEDEPFKPFRMPDGRWRGESLAFVCGQEGGVDYLEYYVTLPGCTDRTRAAIRQYLAARKGART